MKCNTALIHTFSSTCLLHVYIGVQHSRGFATVSSVTFFRMADQTLLLSIECVQPATSALFPAVAGLKALSFSLNGRPDPSSLHLARSLSYYSKLKAHQQLSIHPTSLWYPSVYSKKSHITSRPRIRNVIFKKSLIPETTFPYFIYLQHLPQEHYFHFATRFL